MCVEAGRRTSDQYGLIRVGSLAKDATIAERITRHGEICLASGIVTERPHPDRPCRGQCPRRRRPRETALRHAILSLTRKAVLPTRASSPKVRPTATTIATPVVVYSNTNDIWFGRPQHQDPCLRQDPRLPGRTAQQRLPVRSAPFSECVRMMTWFAIRRPTRCMACPERGFLTRTSRTATWITTPHAILASAGLIGPPPARRALTDHP